MRALVISLVLLTLSVLLAGCIEWDARTHTTGTVVQNIQPVHRLTTYQAVPIDLTYNITIWCQDRIGLEYNLINITAFTIYPDQKLLFDYQRGISQYVVEDIRLQYPIVFWGSIYRRIEDSLPNTTTYSETQCKIYPQDRAFAYQLEYYDMNGLHNATTKWCDVERILDEQISRGYTQYDITCRDNWDGSYCARTINFPQDIIRQCMQEAIGRA